MGQSLAIPRVIPNDWKRLDLIVNKIKMRLGRDSSPTFAGLTITTTDWTDYLPLVNITNLDVNAIQSYALLLRGGANNLVGLTFQVQDYDGNTDFVITGNGYVGVGATPFQKLTLEHGHYIAWPTVAGQANSRSWGIRNDYDNYGDFSIRSSNANDNTLDTTRLIIDKDGNVGIWGKLTVGSFASPTDVTATRQYGFELHYSGNDYDVTGIRSRARLKTTDTTATAQGALLQAANEDGIDVGVLNGALIEAIGKSDGNAATIAVMRGALVNTEWGDYDTVTNLKTLHVRTHSRNAAGAGSFGTGYGIYLENEAVGGNGQALDAGIYLKGTNLSAGNKAFTYGIDFTGATYGTSQINLIADGSITMAGTQVIKFDGTNFNVLLGCDVFNNDEGQFNVGLGYQAGYNNDTTGAGAQGDTNVYIGYLAGYGSGGSNTGFYNVAVGYRTLYANSSGHENFALGYRALESCTTGSFNIAIGRSVLFTVGGGGNNIGIGGLALNVCTSFDNIAIGKSSMALSTSGRYNTAIGTSSLFSNTVGLRNVGIGYAVLSRNQGGDDNVVIGEQAGGSGQGGAQADLSQHTCIGTKSGNLLANTSAANIFIGYYSGSKQTTNSNRLIVDNRQRADANTELTNAIFYGVMAATPASQTLRVNAEVTVTDGLILAKTSGVGIKVDTTTPTFGFADLLGDQFSKNTGGTKPTLIAYNGAIDAWQFSDGDEAYLTYHIPHDYVPGTDIHLHIHWSQNNAGATGGTIDFKYFAIYSKGHNQASGSTFTSTPITDTFSSIDINDGNSGLNQYQHHITEVIISAASATAALFDRDDFEPDGVIELTFEMDANNLTGTPSDPFIHYVDIHYQTTGLIGTKQKAPDFYT